MRQFVAQNIGAIEGAQNTNPHRRRCDDFTVELLMLFQPLGIILCRDKDPPLIHPRQGKQNHPGEDIQDNRVDNQHPDTFEHLIDRHGINDA